MPEIEDVAYFEIMDSTARVIKIEAGRGHPCVARWLRNNRGVET